MPFICIIQTFPIPGKGTSSMHYISTWSWQYVPDDQGALPSSPGIQYSACAHCLPQVLSFIPNSITCIFQRPTFRLPEPMFPALMENWKDLRMFVSPWQPITGWMTDGCWDIDIAASLFPKARQL